MSIAAPALIVSIVSVILFFAIDAFSACTNFASPAVAWDTQTGVWFNATQTGGSSPWSISGAFHTSCGALAYSGTIDSSGSILWCHEQHSLIPRVLHHTSRHSILVLNAFFLK